MGLGKTYSTKYLLDSNNSSGVAGQVLISTATGVNWSDGTDIIGGPYLPLVGGIMTGTITMDSANIDIKSSLGVVGTILSSSNSLTLNARYTGDMIFQSGGAEKMRIANGGNVGIGTTSPSTTLQLTKANTEVLANQPAWPTGILEITDTSAYNAGTGATIVFRKKRDSTGNQVTVGAIAGEGVAGDSRLSFWTGTAAYMGTAPKMVIDDSGNVGIGTTSPNYKFEVEGVISSADAGLQKATFANVGNDLVLTANADATNVTANILFKSSGAGGAGVSEKMRIDSAGNVGIGVTGPNGLLHVRKDQAAETKVIIQNNNGAGAGVRLELSVGEPSSDDSVVSFNVGNGGADWSVGVDNSDADKFKISGGTDSHNPNLGANNKLTITTGGNVGIGTTNPHFNLQITGGNATEETVLKLDKGATSDTGGHTTILGLGTEGGSWAKAGIGFERTGSYDIGSIHFLMYPPGLNTGSVSLSDSVMTIKNNGNVGIGTDDPDNLLHVQGSNNPRIDLGEDTNNKGWMRWNNADNYIDFTTRVGGTYYSDTLVLRNGNVGIGTTSPSSLLTLNKATGEVGILLEGNGTDVAKFKLASADVNHAVQIGSISNNEVQFHTANSEKMRLAANGNVGIGTTSPNSKLTVSGPATPSLANGENSIRIESHASAAASPGELGNGINFAQKWWSGSAGLQVTGGIYGIKNGANGTYGGGLAFYTQPSSAADMAQRMIIDTDGNVGIGTDSPGAKLEVQNHATTTSVADIIIDGKRTDGNNGAVGELIFSNNGDTFATVAGFRDGADNKGSFQFQTQGTLGFATRMTIATEGEIILNQYTLTQQTANSVYLLGVDSSGKVVQSTNIPSGTGGSAGPYLPLAGGTMTGTNGVLMPDNFKLKFGDATTPDLEIFHNGSNSYVRDSGTGGLVLEGSTMLELKARSGELYLRGNENSSVQLYHNNNLRLTTTQAGVDMVGLRVDSSGDIGLIVDPSAGTFSIGDISAIADGVHITGDTTSIYIKENDGTSVNTKVTFNSNGSQTNTGAITATNFILSSDKTLKDNIKEIDTKHVDVEWKNFELKSEPGVKRSGVIAQELEEKHPEFVRTNKDGLKSVAYIDLLIAKIAELEARLEKAGL